MLFSRRVSLRAEPVSQSEASKCHVILEGGDNEKPMDLHRVQRALEVSMTSLVILEVCVIRIIG